MSDPTVTHRTADELPSDEFIAELDKLDSVDHTVDVGPVDRLEYGGTTYVRAHFYDDLRAAVERARDDFDTNSTIYDGPASNAYYASARRLDVILVRLDGGAGADHRTTG